MTMQYDQMTQLEPNGGNALNLLNSLQDQLKQQSGGYTGHDGVLRAGQSGPSLTGAAPQAPTGYGPQGGSMNGMGPANPYMNSGLSSQYGQAGFGNYQSGQPLAGNQSIGNWYDSPYLNRNTAPGTRGSISGSGIGSDYINPTDQQRNWYDAWNRGAYNGPAQELGGVDFATFARMGGFGDPGEANPIGVNSPNLLNGFNVPQELMGLFGDGGGPAQGAVRPDGQGGSWQNNGGGNVTREMPGTSRIPGAGGIRNNMPAWNGNAMSFLQGLGQPVPDFMNTLAGGKPISSYGDMGAAMQGLGGWTGGMPSPQSLGNMSNTDLGFFQGFLETLLGLPMDDFLSAAYQPYKGLGSATKSRRKRTNNPRT